MFDDDVRGIASAKLRKAEAEADLAEAEVASEKARARQEAGVAAVMREQCCAMRDKAKAEAALAEAQQGMIELAYKAAVESYAKGNSTLGGN